MKEKPKQELPEDDFVAWLDQDASERHEEYKIWDKILSGSSVDYAYRKKSEGKKEDKKKEEVPSKKKAGK